ncbi:MAG: 16S rRNA (guanine(527)-N(7))-methyltransferase RsmG [Rickettsiales bacterium]|jgi:16S rRNA (guanine527-N7)-methyltransferase|nr:16S rRNA (guanine(527)-N(7))-methyltransferase RsmG [Rickettsiales bacterium]
MFDKKNYPKLGIYESLLKTWNEKLNLVANSTLENAWERHFVDSLQLAEILKDKDAFIYDLGAGAGFPSLVLSEQGYKNVYAVEKLAKKAKFLEEVKKELKLPVNILNTNISKLKINKKPVFIARAFASLVKIFDITATHFRLNPEYVLLKGERWKEEVEEAKKFYDFDLKTKPSITSDKSMILIINNVRKKK